MLILCVFCCLLECANRCTTLVSVIYEQLLCSVRASCEARKHANMYYKGNFARVIFMIGCVVYQYRQKWDIGYGMVYVF